MSDHNREINKKVKIVGIACSPHRDGMTSRLLHEALEGAKAAGAETSVFRLAEQELAPCRGCDSDCWEKGKCAFVPETSGFNRALQEAGGIVMAVPVYFWQMNGLAHLFIDRMRWNTGSVIEHGNARAAFGIACAGGSGTGCVLALQALYRYFYNCAFHGVKPLPVTRFNFDAALAQARSGGEELARLILGGLKPFADFGSALVDLEALPYMRYGPIDELKLIVRQLCDCLAGSSAPDAHVFLEEVERAERAYSANDRQLAELFGRAYEEGCRLWELHHAMKPGE